MAKQDDWKGKYRDLAQEFEDLERQFTAINDSFRTVVSSLVIAAKGSSPKLDDSLDQLRPLLQADALDSGKLKKASKLIDRSARDSDVERSRQAKALLSSLLDWIKLLKQRCAVAPEQLENLVELEVGASSAVESQYELVPLISKLVACERDAPVTASPSAAAIDEPQIPEAPLSAISPEAVMSQLNSEQMSSALDPSETLQEIANELTELLSGLYLPESESEVRESLVGRITAGLSLEDLPEILHEILHLISKVSSRTSKDFENYLLGLSTQLADVQIFLVDSREAQKQASEDQHLLDVKVRTNIRDLSVSVKSSTDLNELKRSVATQLKSLAKTMDHFRATDSERNQRMTERYNALKQKVADMEEESQKVKAHMEEERRRARTDSLTGLPNRASYEESLSSEFGRWNRYGTSFSMIVADIDFFKRVNDTYGHQAGDKVLRLVGKVLRKQLRSTDFLARIGGEEFVILMPSTDLKQAGICAEKLRLAVESCPFNFGGKPVTVTMSFGVAEVASDLTAEQLFEKADQRLYQAKGNGRNQVVFS